MREQIDHSVLNGPRSTVAAERHGTSFRRCPAMVALLILIAPLARALGPEWWGAALDQGQSQNSHAAANAGQLKNLAAHAMAVMDERGYGAGAGIHALVESWNAPPFGNDFAAINAGQLKAVAQPFYDRLAELGLSQPGSYPWVGGGDNNAVVNVGQLKNVFSFTLPRMTPVVTLESGDSQFVRPGFIAASPLTLKLTTPQGAPCPGWQVTLSPSSGAIAAPGTAVNGAGWDTSAALSTDSEGRVSVSYKGGGAAADAYVFISLGLGQGPVKSFTLIVDEIHLQGLSASTGTGKPGASSLLLVQAVRASNSQPAKQVPVSFAISGDGVATPYIAEVTSSQQGLVRFALTLPTGDNQTIHAQAGIASSIGTDVVSFDRTTADENAASLTVASSDASSVTVFYAELGTDENGMTTPTPVAGQSLYAYLVAGEGTISASITTDESGLATFQWSRPSTQGTTEFLITDATGRASTAVFKTTTGPESSPGGGTGNGGDTGGGSPITGLGGVPLMVQQLTYDGQGRLTAVSASPWTYTYDLEGNLTSKNN